MCKGAKQDVENTPNVPAQVCKGAKQDVENTPNVPAQAWGLVIVMMMMMMVKKKYSTAMYKGLRVSTFIFFIFFFFFLGRVIASPELAPSTN